MVQIRSRAARLRGVSSTNENATVLYTIKFRQLNKTLEVRSFQL